MMFQELSLRLKRFDCQRNSGSTVLASLAKLAMDSWMYSGALRMMVMKTAATLMKMKLAIAMMVHPLTHSIYSDGDGDVDSSNITMQCIDET